MMLVPSVSDYIQAIQDNVSLARDRHAEAKTKQTNSIFFFDSIEGWLVCVDKDVEMGFVDYMNNDAVLWLPRLQPFEAASPIDSPMKS